MRYEFIYEVLWDEIYELGKDAIYVGYDVDMMWI
jgi:hypothetical protein